MQKTISANRVLIQRLTPYLFLLPALLILGLTVFLPAVQAFYLSFTRYEYDLTQPPQWIGVANFKRLWGDRVFWKTLQNTVLYLIGVVPILVTFPLAIAILVNQKLRGMNWFRAAFWELLLFFYVYTWQKIDFKTMTVLLKSLSSMAEIRYR